MNQRTLHKVDGRGTRTLASVVAIGILLAGIVVFVRFLASPTTPSESTHEEYAVSHAYGFNSVSAMARGSDLVAEVTVMSGEYQSDAHPAPSTVYTLHVERILANNKGGAVASTISDNELGGGPANGNVQVEGSLAYPTGARLILFLKQYGPGQYTTIEGSESVFIVKDGMVDALAQNPAERIPTFTSPVSLPTFETQVSS